MTTQLDTLPTHTKTRTPKPYRFGIYQLTMMRVGDSEVMEKPALRDPADAARILFALMEPFGLLHERFVVIPCDSSNKPKGYFEVTVGTLNSSLVHPREVFQRAILCNAANIILAHNHPSGNPEPSQEDMAITRQLVEAGKILGIPVLDHLIICTETKQYTSLAERGLI